MESNYKDYYFHIRSIILLDPALKPSMKKPNEEDIQDAKLLYYFPPGSTIHEKRNHVGLAEGGYLFWEQTLNKDYSGINFDDIKPTKQQNQTETEQFDFKKQKSEEQQLAKIDKNESKEDKKSNTQLHRSKESSILEDNPIQIDDDLLGLQERGEESQANKQDEDLINFEDKDSKILSSFQQDLLEINFQEPQNLENDSVTNPANKDVQMQQFEEFKQEPQNTFASKLDDIAQQLNANEPQQQEKNQQERDLSKNYQITFMDRYIHILKEIENSLWIYIVIKKENEKPDLFCSNPGNYEEEPKKNDINTYFYQKFTEDSCLIFCNDFAETFQFFYGKFRNFFEDELKKPTFGLIFDEYVARYQILNANDHRNINILRYQMQGFKYAPIDKHNFLTIQYLLHIMTTLDKNIKHQMIYYSGYFLYSSLKHEHSLFLYNYFFAGGNPLESDENKIQNKFTRIGQIEKTQFYGYFFNSLSLSQSQLSKSSSQPQLGEQDNRISQLIDPQLIQPLQLVEINNEKYQLNIIQDKKLLILQFYPVYVNVTQKSIIELNSAVLKNSEKIKFKLDKSIEKIASQDEPTRFIYHNEQNQAFKITNSLLLKEIFPDQLQIIEQIYKDLKRKNNQIIKEPKAWFWGANILGRTIIVMFEKGLTLLKMQDEIDKINKQYFNNLFL